MRGSVKIGRVAGVPIKLHWSFSLLVLLVVLANPHGTWSTIWPMVVWIVVLFASVTIHELAHCMVARRRGLTVNDIVLLPIGGVSEINGLPAAPAIERDIAIAGPAASFALAILLGVAALIAGDRIWPPALLSGPLLVDLAWMNLVLCGFNLLPALPMDGGRVLRAVLAGRGDPLRATRIASGVAVVLGAAMVVVGFRYDIWLVFIGAFVVVGANGERRLARVQASFNGLRVGDVMAHDPTTVLSSVTAQQLLPWLQAYPGRAVPIVENGRYLGLAAVEDLIAHPVATVGEACDKSAPVLDASQPIFPAALEAFSQFPRNQLAAMSGGYVVGVIYRWTVQAVARQDRGPVAATQPGG
ncbi:MAG: site-2 protease family protein [Acidimicrobiales bacterium]